MDITRQQADELSAGVLRAYLDAEDEILRMIAEQLAADGDLSDTSKWRIRQLARAGATLIGSFSGNYVSGQAFRVTSSTVKLTFPSLDEAAEYIYILAVLNKSVSLTFIQLLASPIDFIKNI